MKNQILKMVVAATLLISFSFAGGTAIASMKKDGKMMCCMDDGKMMSMDKDMTIGDVKVGTNGTVTMKDGKKMMLKEGMMCDKSGTIMPYNGAMMKDGKMMVIKDGKMSPMTDKEMKMGDHKMMKDGTMVMKDGKKMTMKDGQMCDMMGNMSSHDDMKMKE